MFKRLSLQSRLMVSFIFILFIVLPLFARTVFVPAGSVWKYLDDGSNQGIAWRAPDFDDSAWKEGPAQLGYGDGDEATVVSYGPDANNKYITTYFRHRFQVENPSQYSALVLRLLRDDGAVVYLNGKEIVRSNMSFGIVTYRTLAASVVSYDAENMFFDYYPPVSALVEGTNVLAVEIHQANASSSDISFDLEFASTTKPPESFRKGPYLIYPAKSNEMTVLWQLHETMPSCTLQWGVDSLYNSGSATVQEYGDDHQYKYTIDSLALNTKYYYRVLAGTDTVAGTFRTAPDSDATTLKFFAYGDTRTQPRNHNAVASGILATIRQDPEFQTFIIVTGDLVGNGDNEADWDNQFFNPNYINIQTLLANLPYLASMGNHERQGKLFAKYFPYHFYQGQRYYYSFDYGPAHFTVIDQYTAYTPGSSQYNWLENDLASTKKKWKFVYLHEPGWSAGGHGNNTYVQSFIQPLCEKYGVSIVFAGHNHYYARAVVNGVYHITTGGGGAPLYSPDPSYPNIVTTANDYHFCKIAIDGDSLRFAAINSNRQLIDEFTLSLPATNVATGDKDAAIPNEMMLYTAYPNPFNPTTTISFTIPGQADVRLDIYNIMGEKVKTLVSGQLQAGLHAYEWDGTNDSGIAVPSGIYLYQLQTKKDRKIKRMILVR